MELASLSEVSVCTWKDDLELNDLPYSYIDPSLAASVAQSKYWGTNHARLQQIKAKCVLLSVLATECTADLADVIDTTRTMCSKLSQHKLLSDLPLHEKRDAPELSNNDTQPACISHR